MSSRGPDGLAATGPRHVVTVECVVVSADPSNAAMTVVKPITRPALRALVSVRRVTATRLEETGGTP